METATQTVNGTGLVTMYNDNSTNCTNLSESCADQLTLCQSTAEEIALNNGRYDKQQHPTPYECEQSQCHGNNGHCVIDSNRIDVSGIDDDVNVLTHVQQQQQQQHRHHHQQATHPIVKDSSIEMTEPNVDVTSPATRSPSPDKMECETNLSIKRSSETVVPSTIPPSPSSPLPNQSDTDERLEATPPIADGSDSNDTMDHTQDTFDATQNNSGV